MVGLHARFLVLRNPQSTNSLSIMVTPSAISRLASMEKSLATHRQANSPLRKRKPTSGPPKEARPAQSLSRVAHLRGQAADPCRQCRDRRRPTSPIFFAPDEQPPGIDSTARVLPQPPRSIDPTAYIGPHSVIAERTHVTAKLR